MLITILNDGNPNFITTATAIASTTPKPTTASVPINFYGNTVGIIMIIAAVGLIGVGLFLRYSKRRQAEVQAERDMEMMEQAKKKAPHAPKVLPLTMADMPVRGPTKSVEDHPPTEAKKGPAEEHAEKSDEPSAGPIKIPPLQPPGVSKTPRPVLADIRPSSEGARPIPAAPERNYRLLTMIAALLIFAVIVLVAPYAHLVAQPTPLPTPTPVVEYVTIYATPNATATPMPTAIANASPSATAYPTLSPSVTAYPTLTPTATPDMGYVENVSPLSPVDASLVALPDTGITPGLLVITDKSYYGSDYAYPNDTIGLSIQYTDLNASVDQVRVMFSVISDDGNTSLASTDRTERWQLHTQDSITRTYGFKVPNGTPVGSYKIRLSVYAYDKETGRYDLFASGLITRFTVLT